MGILSYRTDQPTSLASITVHKRGEDTPSRRYRLQHLMAVSSSSMLTILCALQFIIILVLIMRQSTLLSVSSFIHFSPLHLTSVSLFQKECSQDVTEIRAEMEQQVSVNSSVFVYACLSTCLPTCMYICASLRHMLIICGSSHESCQRANQTARKNLPKQKRWQIKPWNYKKVQWHRM